MIKHLLIPAFLFMVAVAMPNYASANVLGCLVGGGAGAAGGSLIGSGNGQLAAVGAGAVLGCLIGDNVSDSVSNQHQYDHHHNHGVVEERRYLTYKERYGCYTMTEYGYVPCEQAGRSFHRMATPGYTYSKSIYYDQRPEAHGIYPVYKRTVIHERPTTIVVPVQPARVDYAALGCLDNGGSPYIREYQTEVTIHGKKVPAYGTACYTPDGSWKVITDPVPTQ